MKRMFIATCLADLFIVKLGKSYFQRNSNGSDSYVKDVKGRKAGPIDIRREAEAVREVHSGHQAADCEMVEGK
jgi:hypothetical protein